ncbi:hypothetical protein N9L68_07265, partial [bacterium]|nr:hypothetical protein [bacterium]
SSHRALAGFLGSGRQQHDADRRASYISLSTTNRGNVTPSPEQVHQWMTDPKTIRLCVYQCPIPRSVNGMLKNWDLINKTQ